MARLPGRTVLIDGRPYGLCEPVAQPCGRIAVLGLRGCIALSISNGTRPKGGHGTRVERRPALGLAADRR